MMVRRTSHFLPRGGLDLVASPLNAVLGHD